jgi:hypothetical protein
MVSSVLLLQVYQELEQVTGLCIPSEKQMQQQTMSFSQLQSFPCISSVLEKWNQPWLPACSALLWACMLFLID